MWRHQKPSLLASDTLGARREWPLLCSQAGAARVSGGRMARPVLPGRPHPRATPGTAPPAARPLAHAPTPPPTCRSSSARRIASRVMPPLLAPSKLRLRGGGAGGQARAGQLSRVRHVVMQLEPVAPVPLNRSRECAHAPANPSRLPASQPGPPRGHPNTSNPHPTSPPPHLMEGGAPPFLVARRRSCTVMRTRSTACVRLPISSPRSSLDM